MSKEKLPSLHLYIGDWLKDEISGCSLAAQGLWLRMLFVMHESEKYGYFQAGGKPIDPETASRRCGCDKNFAFVLLLQELDKAGVIKRNGDGIIYSERMKNDAIIREIRRKSGRKGGRPPVVKDKQEPGKANSKANGKQTESKLKANVKHNHDNDNENEDKSLSGIIPKQGTPEWIAYRSTLTPNQLVVLGWKKTLGMDWNDKLWDKKWWKRCAGAARELLEIFSGDVSACQDCAYETYTRMKKDGLGCTLETVVRESFDWRAKRNGTHSDS